MDDALRDGVLDLGDGIAYATLDVLALHLRVPAGTLRRWATEDKWPSRLIQRRRYYLASSARNSYRDRGRARRDTLRRGA